MPDEMPKGSVLVYTGALNHGGADRSDAIRCGLNITNALSWLSEGRNGEPAPCSQRRCRRGDSNLQLVGDPPSPSVSSEGATGGTQQRTLIPRSHLLIGVRCDACPPASSPASRRPSRAFRPPGD